MKKLLFALLLAVPCYADQVAVSQFKGINADDNAVTLDPSYAQDLLNVDISNTGRSIKKRPGYGLYKTLPTSQAIHGGIHFFDASGNDVQVWGSSTSIYGIVADASATQIVSSMTLNSTIDCADTQGSAYCVSSNRDFYIKTNGASLTNWATSPLGTIIEATPDRIVVAGVPGSLNTIYHSASNSFFNYTAGPLTTDPFTEVIAAPGSKITHLRYACGKLLWWKDQSFGYEAFDDQYSLQIKIVSDNIGTFDNTSAVDPGGNVWFRGQDGHIWRYDCAGLTKESLEISPFIQASSKRTSNYWTISSQTEFQTGSSSPTAPAQPLSYTISSGDVVPGSYTVTENSSSQWNSGTASNVTVNASNITLSTNNSGTATNPSFESALAGTWTDSHGIFTRAASVTGSCTINPQSGSWFVYETVAGLPSTDYFEVVDLNGNILAQVAHTFPGSCAWQQLTATVSSTDIGKRVKFRIERPSGRYLTTNDSYILGGSPSIYVAYSNTGSTYYYAYDNIQNGSSTITSGTFTSQAFNTGLPFGYVYPTATWTVNSSTPSFVLQKSADGSTGWYDVAVGTAVNAQTSQKYIRYLSTLTVSGTETALSSLSSVTLVERSSGTYYSAIKNASSINAWSTFNPTYTNNGGSHNFYIRVGNFTWDKLSTSAPLMTALTPNAVVSSTWTAPYFQIVDSFTVTSATDTAPTLSDFTLNWFEGTATDQAYMQYFDNSIWADVAYGVGVSSNTYIFKRDLVNDAWLLYNFGAGGMMVQNNRLFFGDVGSTGKIYQYESGHSDAGNAINAFWKSKNFSGADPFLQQSLTNIDVFAKKDQGSTLTATYVLDTSTTTTSYSIPLSSATASVIQSRKSLPAGKNGYQFNLKLGDSSDSSDWEVFGFRMTFNPNPYRSTP